MKPHVKAQSLTKCILYILHVCTKIGMTLHVINFAIGFDILFVCSYAIEIQNICFLNVPVLKSKYDIYGILFREKFHDHKMTFPVLDAFLTSRLHLQMSLKEKISFRFIVKYTWFQGRQYITVHDIRFKEL